MTRRAAIVASILTAVLALAACGSSTAGGTHGKTNTDPVGVGHAYDKANDAMP